MPLIGPSTSQAHSSLGAELSCQHSYGRPKVQPRPAPLTFTQKKSKPWQTTYAPRSTQQRLIQNNANRFSGSGQFALWNAIARIFALTPQKIEMLKFFRLCLHAAGTVVIRIGT